MENHMTTTTPFTGLTVEEVVARIVDDLPLNDLVSSYNSHEQVAAKLQSKLDKMRPGHQFRFVNDHEICINVHRGDKLYAVLSRGYGGRTDTWLAPRDYVETSEQQQ